MQPITPASPGQPLRASDINAQSSELRRQGNTFFEGGTLSQEAGGVHLSADATASFFAKITKRNTTFSPPRYGFKEVYRAKSAWIEVDGGRWSDGTINYALEFNGNTYVPVNAVVELRPIFSFVDVDIINQVYGFLYHYMMPTSLENFIEVVTSVQCTTEGISTSTVALCGGQYENVYLRQFLQLTDVTPKSYLGNANRAVVVNAAGTALEFGAVINHMAGSFIALADTPASYTAGRLVVVNSAGSALEFSSTLQTTVSTLQTTVSTLQNSLSALAVRVSALGG